MAIFEVQNKRFLGQNPLRVCIDAVFRWQILCQQNVLNPREYWIVDATVSTKRPIEACLAMSVSAKNCGGILSPTIKRLCAVVDTRPNL